MAKNIEVYTQEETLDVYSQEEAASVNIENGVVVFSNGSGPVTWLEVMNKPETFPPEDHEHNVNDVSGLANVAKTGSYNDLKDKPTEFAPATHGHAAGEVTGLAAVATSGSYNDLTDKPVIEDNNGAANIVDGEADGSLRSVGSSPESNTYKLGKNAAAFGEDTYADGQGAFAEGVGSWAAEEGAHAEGFNTYSAGRGGHAEGVSTEALASGAHAEGYSTHAKATGSHAEGSDTIANGVYQHVQGKFNVQDNEDKYAHIVGNGESNTRRSNAHTVDWSGNGWFKGDVYVGGTDQTTGDRLVKKTELDAVAEAGNSNGIFVVRYNKETGLADKTQAEIRAAVAQKIPCIAVDSLGCVYNYVGEETYQKDRTMIVPTFRHAMDYDGNGGITFREMQIPGSGEMSIWGNSKVSAPNPKSLRLTGAVNATYDGSTAVTVNIPTGGTGSGEDGGYYTPNVDSNGVLTWTASKTGMPSVAGANIKGADGADGKTPVKGIDYTDGAPGYTPQKNIDYFDGKDGKDGTDGEDGFSPIVSVTRITGGVRIDAQNKDGMQSATVYDGQSGSGEGGGGLPTGDGPNMMLVTDADGNAKWDERTHWKEEGLIDILPECNFEADPDTGEGVIMTPFVSIPDPGKTYTVSWNGTAYECIAEVGNMDGVPLFMLGNTSAFGGTQATEDPFLIIAFPAEIVESMGGVTANVLAFDGSTEITLRIQQAGTNYHKLDARYLPIPMVDALSDYLKETTLEVSPDEGMGAIVEPFSKPLAIGKTYTVTWNGSQHTCTAWAYSEGGELQMPALGNGAALDESFPASNDPFLVVFVPDVAVEEIGGFHGMVIPLDGSETVTLSIHGDGGVKIAEEALDMDWVPKKGDVGATILPETVVTENVELPSDIIWPSAGEKVIVYFDHVRYECRVMLTDDDSFNYIGNVSIKGTNFFDTGEPFLITIMNGGAITSVFFDGDTGLTQAHRIAIYADGSIAKGDDTIPNSFLPDGGVFYVNATQETVDSEYKADKTITEAYEAYYSGRMVCLRLADVKNLNNSVLCWPSEICHTSARFFSLNGIVVTSVEWDYEGKIVVITKNL